MSWTSAWGYPPLVAVVLGVVAFFRITVSRGRLRGRWWAGLGVAIGLVGVYAGVGMMLTGSRLPKRSRATADTKTAVTQSVVYAGDHRVYPNSLKTLRDANYANIPDRDPWGHDYVLSPRFLRGEVPEKGEDAYIYSKGPCGTGTYSPAGWQRRPAEEWEHGTGGWILDTGTCGAVGYSSIYGSFRGR